MTTVKLEALSARVRALAEAVEACRGRCAAEAVADADEVVRRAGRRVAFSGARTVVAIAGATGSGKSSTFNAITGTALAEVGVRRPTTSHAMAVAWGSDLPHDILDWLEVTRRHLIPAGESPFADLILLDLPDHDSTEREHRVEVDRLVQVVDALVWVVDPQKYADAALHDSYLKPLAPYAEVMMVVLNQSDRLSRDELARCVADLRRLLDAEGLARTPILTASALTGDGIEGLRTALARVVAQKKAMAVRLSTDVDVAATRLAGELGEGRPVTVAREVRSDLVRALSDAAGVPLVVEGVLQAWRRRGSAATGWPFVSWINRLRPDPLRRLRLDTREGEPEPTATNRTSLPRPDAVQRARVDQALRRLTDEAAAGLPREWAVAVRAGAKGRDTLLMDQLDVAIAGADLRLGRGIWWWSVVRVMQWLLIVAVLAGALWWASGPVLASFGLPALPVVLWYDIPAATWLLGGGLLGGILLAGLSRVIVEFGARAKARVARKILREVVGAVTATAVLAPVEAELKRFHTAVEAVRRAQHAGGT